MDINLPGMNGLDAMKQLQQAPETENQKALDLRPLIRSVPRRPRHGSPEAGIVRVKSPGTPGTPKNAKLRESGVT
jgi:hypothetical protein